MNIELKFSLPCDIDEIFLSQLISLINDVYQESEAGMWQDGFQRVALGDVLGHIKRQEFIFAYVDEMLVGSILVTQPRDRVGEFGMLVCAPEYRRLGIGRQLIAASEEKSRQGGCHMMQLEVLHPKFWKQPTKEILKKWYPRLGYKKGAEEDFQQRHPDLVPYLATECSFTVYSKLL